MTHAAPLCWSALAVLWLCLAAPSTVIAAEETPHVSDTKDRKPAAPKDPLSLIEGSPNAWSVSRTDAGCYLLSPQRDKASHLALGWHPTLGLGLFMVNFALALPSRDLSEPMRIEADGLTISKTAHLVGNRLLFAALAPAEADSVIAALREQGLLWEMVRQTRMSHGGLALPAALDEFATTCAAPPQ
jgi:hypothetical protein